MHECFLLFLLSGNPVNCDYLVHNVVCRQTAQIDFPEVGWQNECIGKQHALAYLLSYIKLGFSSKYPLK